MKLPNYVFFFFDKLFDSVNGNFNEIINGKIYRTAMKINSPHHQLWAESIKILNTMQFVNVVTGERSSPQTCVLTNWIKTIMGNCKTQK